MPVGVGQGDLQPPVQLDGGLGRGAEVDEAAVEADQLTRPHPPHREQPRPRPRHPARPHRHRGRLEGVGEVRGEARAVEAGRGVGEAGVGGHPGADQPGAEVHLLHHTVMTCMQCVE